MTHYLKNHLSQIIWFFIATIYLVGDYLLKDNAQSTWANITVMLVIWVVTAQIFASPYNPQIGLLKIVRYLPFIFWLIGILAFFAIIAIWLVIFQPAVGITLSPIEIFFLSGSWICLFGYFSIDLTRAELDRMGAKLRWRTNLLITVTTLVLIIFGIEFGMRYFLVMSDNFAFSKMHQNWVRLYWNPINTWGYRDNEPHQDANLRHIIVMGDSLAAGYGVNHIEDTFPHILEKLVPSASVNIVAQPGWGTSTALGALKDYPVVPQTLVMSFFLNDIVEGPAKDAYQTPFPGIRLNPDPTTEWWVNNFYIANFYYYRIYHYTTVNSGQKYLDWILGAYKDASVWQAYQQELGNVITWSQDHNTQLIVLIWGNLANLDMSRDATAQVRDYFVAQSIPVVYMPDLLSQESVSRLTVNVFDAHPSTYSHQVAAQNLFDTLTTLESTP